MRKKYLKKEERKGEQNKEKTRIRIGKRSRKKK